MLDRLLKTNANDNTWQAFVWGILVDIVGWYSGSHPAPHIKGL